MEAHPAFAVYGPVRRALCQGVNRLLPDLAAVPEDFDCRVSLTAPVTNPFTAVRCALPLRRRQNAAALAAVLDAQKQTFVSPFGGELVQRVWANGGHLLFCPAKAFYDGALLHTIAVLPCAPFPAEDEALFYERCRMAMQARQPGTGCPDVPAVQRFVWLALGIPEADAACRGGLRRQAAEAFVTLFDGLSPAERHALHKRCGAVGEAAARLFSHEVKKDRN